MPYFLQLAHLVGRDRLSNNFPGQRHAAGQQLKVAAQWVQASLQRGHLLQIHLRGEASFAKWRTETKQKERERRAEAATNPNDSGQVLGASSLGLHKFVQKGHLVGGELQVGVKICNGE